MKSEDAPRIKLQEAEKRVATLEKKLEEAQRQLAEKDNRLALAASEIKELTKGKESYKQVTQLIRQCAYTRLIHSIIIIMNK